MPRFILVRHGEAEFNAKKLLMGWTDSPLTTVGHEQATGIAATLPAKIDIMFSSDLMRARQTADHIREQYSTDLPIFYDWRLRERCFGELEGKPVDPAEIDKSFADKSGSYRGSEPVAHVNERIKSFVRDCALFDADTILVVAHSGTLNRFGFLFDDDHSHQTFPNGSTVEFTIDYNDPRLAPGECPAWTPTAASS